MVCPLCNTEARIVSTQNILRGNELFVRYSFSCRNKNCNRYETEVGNEEVQQELIIDEEESE